MNVEIDEMKNTYYEYVNNVSEGCQTISNNLRTGNLADAFQSIANFAEGLEWLLKAEDILAKEGFQINSRISEATEFMIEINSAIEEQDVTLIADLFEYEIKPIFSSASEWVFVQ